MRTRRIVLQGGMTPAERREVAGQLARIPDTEPRLVLATGRYIGEGFDDARLSSGRTPGIRST
jgi:hypothetical protein